MTVLKVPTTSTTALVRKMPFQIPFMYSKDSIKLFNLHAIVNCR